jgi:hypothetical protein
LKQKLRDGDHELSRVTLAKEQAEIELASRKDQNDLLQAK